MKTALPEVPEHLLSEGSRRQWAHGILAIPAGASADAVRAVLLGRLQDFNFMPPPPVRQAIWILGDMAERGNLDVDCADPFEDDVEARLNNDIEEFARTFFDRNCAERRRRWEELTSQARLFPRLRLRLAPLMPGLDITAVVPQDDPKAELLAHRTMLLFVLPLVQQERVRQQWLREMKQSGPWKSHVRSFRARFANLARLDADLLIGLEVQETTGPRRISARTAIPGVVSRAKSKFMPTKVPKAGAGGKPILAIAWLCLICVSGLVRQFSESVTPSPAHPNSQSFTVPERPIPDYVQRLLLKSNQPPARNPNGVPGWDRLRDSDVPPFNQNDAPIPDDIMQRLLKSNQLPASNRDASARWNELRDLDVPPNKHDPADKPGESLR